MPVNQLAYRSPPRARQDNADKAKFSTGFNAGSRHTLMGGAPPYFDLTAWSHHYQAGYKLGVIARKEGKLTDEVAATNVLNELWRIYSLGGV